MDVAIDLGTANTLVYVAGRGVVINEPSVVAIDTRSKRVLAVGADAKLLIGRTPSHIRAMRPIKDGVVAHLGVTQQMLSFFLGRLRRWRWPKPRVVVCVPSGLTEVEQRAIGESAKAAGARQVFLLEESIAAAIGAGLPIQEPEGAMIVDIGGGTSEVAVISYGGVVDGTSLRTGGDELDEAIIQHVRKEHSISLGERSAEQLKMELASAHPVGDDLTGEVRGRDLVTGLPKALCLTGHEIRRAVAEPVQEIVDAVRAVLDRCPPELAGDIMNAGMVLTGGGALLAGMAERLHEETHTPVVVAEDPLSCVARGAGDCIEHFRDLRSVFIQTGTSTI